ncbi:unnamed protein product, partial [Arabidopsis lyrata]
MYRMS